MFPKDYIIHEINLLSVKGWMTVNCTTKLKYYNTFVMFKSSLSLRLKLKNENDRHLYTMLWEHIMTRHTVSRVNRFISVSNCRYLISCELIFYLKYNLLKQVDIRLHLQDSDKFHPVQFHTVNHPINIIYVNWLL